MSRQELIDHLEEIVKDAEAHLERLRAAIAQGMHFANLDMEQRLKCLEAICAEQRRLMSEHFGK